MKKTATRRNGARARARLPPSRSVLSHGARDLGIATQRRRSYPTQRSYSRRTPALTRTLTDNATDGSHYGNESSRRMRERPHSARARVKSFPLPVVCPSPLPVTRIPRSIDESTAMGSAPFSNCISNIFEEGCVKMFGTTSKYVLQKKNRRVYLVKLDFNRL